MGKRLTEQFYEDLEQAQAGVQWARERGISAAYRVRTPDGSVIALEREGVCQIAAGWPEDTHKRVMVHAENTASGAQIYAPQQYAIPEENIDALRRRIEEINRRAETLGVEPLHFDEVGEEFREERAEPDRFGGYYAQFESRKVTRRYVLVEVGGSRVQLEGGWRFVGTLQHEAGGNVVRAVPGETLPDRFRHAGARCDHCELERQRNDTFVVKNDAGDYWQVGRTCLRDFVGHVSPERLATLAQWLSELAGEIANLEESSGGGKTYLPTGAYLAWVAAAVRLWGWTSRTKAREDGRKQASADDAWSMMHEAKPDGIVYDKKTGAPRTTRDGRTVQLLPEDTERAKAALAWAQGLDGADLENDYLWNLHLVAQKEALGHRDLGLAASAIFAYERVQADAREQAEQKPSEWQGTPKKRQVFEGLELVYVLETDGWYGTKWMHKFVDGDGNIFIWWKTTYPPLELGTVYAGKATVKEHDEYRGEKQTVINRANFEPMETEEA